MDLYISNLTKKLINLQNIKKLSLSAYIAQGTFNTIRFHMCSLTQNDTICSWVIYRIIFWRLCSAVIYTFEFLPYSRKQIHSLFYGSCEITVVYSERQLSYPLVLRFFKSISSNKKYIIEVWPFGPKVISLICFKKKTTTSLLYLSETPFLDGSCF